MPTGCSEQGLLDVDAPVVQYWPEFAQSGKDAVTVGDLLAHPAGLPWIDGTMSFDEAIAWDPVGGTGPESPAWSRTDHGYHAVTFGYLVGEVVRRITGRTLGTYFREEVAAPLDADWYVGLPAAEEHRVACLVPGPAEPVRHARQSRSGIRGLIRRCSSSRGARPLHRS